MPIVRIYLEAAVDYEGEHPFYFDVAIDPDGNPETKRPIFGVCGDFSRTARFWPVVLFPETGSVDFGEAYDGNSGERRAVTDLLRDKIRLGREVSFHSEQYGAQMFKVAAVISMT